MIGRMRLPIMPPVEPMLAKSVSGVPAPDSVAGGLAYEPKWDGFRCIVFRDGDEVELASRNGRPITRYFPELVTGLREQLPARCVLDGEVVVAAGGRLQFELLQQRIHPAESRVRMLAERTPARFVAFDALALDDADLTTQPFAERRGVLESLVGPPPADPTAADGPTGRARGIRWAHLTPICYDHATALQWFTSFEGAGLDSSGDEHPWADWQDPESGRRPGAQSRWSTGKDLSFTPLRPERVLEVAYDHMEGTRFRHTAQFRRWREDRDPAGCTFDQLEEPVGYDLAAILPGS